MSNVIYVSVSYVIIYVMICIISYIYMCMHMYMYHITWWLLLTDEVAGLVLECQKILRETAVVAHLPGFLLLGLIRNFTAECTWKFLTRYGIGVWEDLNLHLCGEFLNQGMAVVLRFSSISNNRDVSGIHLSTKQTVDLFL